MTISRLRLLACAALLLSACGHPATPFRLSHKVPKDLAARRIPDRESLTLASGVRVHADHMFTSLAGTVQFSGRVFLDGSQQSVPAAATSVWPVYAYADNAWWDAERGSFKMNGHVAVEQGNGVVTRGVQAAASVTVDGGRFKIEESPRTSSSALPQHW